MNFNFKTDKDFLSILLQKRAAIIAKTSIDIREINQFKELHASLITYVKNNNFNDFKAILIEKEEIKNLPSDFYLALERQLNLEDSVVSNFIYLNRDLAIIKKERNFSYNSDSETARKHYRTLSLKYIVFLLQPEHNVSLFIDGEDYIQGIFLTPKDIQSYIAKKSIADLPLLLDEYRLHLKKRDTYSKFFISKSHLKSLRHDLQSDLAEDKFIHEYRHLLENTPEDRFREDLRYFLQSRLKANLLAKEYILQNFRRLDIFIIDESGFELYLVEVKWVGECISNDGKRISNTSFDEKDICPAAVIQSVKYIHQLALEKKNIKLGFLVVFDARKNQNLNDTCNNFNQSILDEDDKKYFSRFKKIPDFKVENLHPS